MQHLDIEINVSTATTKNYNKQTLPFILHSIDISQLPKTASVPILVLMDVCLFDRGLSNLKQSLTNQYYAQMYTSHKEGSAEEFIIVLACGVAFLTHVKDKLRPRLHSFYSLIPRPMTKNTTQSLYTVLVRQNYPALNEPKSFTPHAMKGS